MEKLEQMSAQSAKQGYQWPHKKDLIMPLPPKFFLKKEITFLTYFSKAKDTS